MQTVTNVDGKRFNRLAVAGLAASFVLQLIVVATAFTTYARNQESSQRVEHTHDVIDRINQAALYVERAETAARGYLLFRDPGRLATYQSNIAQVDPTLDALESQVADNPVQVKNFAELRARVSIEVAEIGQTMKLAAAGQTDAALEQYRGDAPLARVVAIRTIAGQMTAEEHQLLAERRDNERHSGNLLKVVLFGAAILMTLAALFTMFVARRYIGDLTAARERLGVLNSDLEGEVDRRTAELRRANEEVQRFAYIVSHDLRSPLVNVLGFTAELDATNKTLGALIARAEKEAPQLLTEDVRFAQEDLPEAIGFIRSSTQKMDRLINAILKLSREGRRTLTPEHLPMDHVVGEIADSLSTMAEDAGATMVVEKPLPDIVNDRVAIEQIFSNIIENAVKYREPSRPLEVAVRGRREGNRAIFEIADNGRGIDPKDHQRIFDLFRRAGKQDVGGEGIGLAQVRGLVNRLGGFIDVTSALGEGSVFRLNLPITYEDHGSGQ